jgi:hypothetical protein
VTCETPTTAVSDPRGDVLTYNVGSPPAQVAALTPELAGIDLTSAVVQIDEDRTVCATFTFASPPPATDFQLTFNFADLTERRCCTSLRFRRSVGGMEVGHFHTDEHGTFQLDPVDDAGASLEGTTLVISGRLPDPSEWNRGGRMPEVAYFAWSVTTGYTPEKYGPYFGDWLPGYQALGSPVIRHWDGATVPR